MTLNPAFDEKLEQREAARTAGGAPAPGPEEAPCVLVVDDEPEITRSIAELLARDYRVLTANSSDDALRLLEENSVSVILTDQRMPGGTGAELLSRSLHIAPETTRILFTGYSDISAVIEAVNEGRVYRYLAKPWRPEELREAVSSGFERHRLILENRRLILGLAQTNQELEAFAYTVSHNLRAPLRHISGFSALLEKQAGDDLDEKSSHYIEMISSSVRQMGALIDDLLHFSRSGRTVPQFVDVDMGASVATAIERLSDQTEGRSVEWTVGPLPHVVGDPLLLQRVWVNLLDNALKFTRGREPALIEVGTHEGDESVESAFFVRDNGIGFDMQYVDKLFGVFQRLHSSAELEGNGIGLAYVQRIVHKHGGRVWARGKLNEGATFSFALPRRPPTP